ncbi:MAG TPA: HlyD family secretion protein [Candidatus Sulfopaludibacter sp.]|nr:HlyD family secretion protein [Candidatus Sulfopaludibacter sp.]
MNKGTSVAAPNANGARLAKLNSPRFVWPAAVVLAVLLYFGLHYLNFTLTNETTDDAFIAANVVSVAPRIAGQVSAVHVLDNEMVHSNELLVEVDPANYATTASQKHASVDAAEANYQVALAGLNLMHEKVTTARATADQSKADAESAKATDALARADFERMKRLREENTISAQEFDVAQAAVQKADADLIAAQQKGAADASKVSEAKADLTATEAAVGMALAEFRQAQANERTAQLELSYTKIFAPCDGRVTRKAVEPGDFVQIGQTLMSVVPTNVYVFANFKESQLKEMKPGQPVLIEIDALAGRTFRGHVDSIQAGSGAAFSLLPPENATGNYVKVVQRVPVKILFDEALPADHTFGPGLSVEPSVRVSRFSLPAWVIGLVALILTGAAARGFQSILRGKLNQTAASEKIQG